VKRKRSVTINSLTGRCESISAMLGWCVARLGGQVIIDGGEVRDLIANMDMVIERSSENDAVRITMKDKLVVTLK
jgi:hypothetical protein